MVGSLPRSRDALGYDTFEVERMSLRTVPVLPFCAIATLIAQQPSQPPSFEVVSIKPAEASARGARFSGGPGTDSPGQLVIRNYPLDRIIARAFDKNRPWEMVHAGSVPTDRYDILAKALPEVTREQFSAMIQNLLAERFGLVVHRETREIAVYELVVAKGGHRFTPVEKPADQTPRPRLNVNSLPKDKDGWPVLPPDAVGSFAASVPPYTRWMYRAQPFSSLLEYLGFILDRPVVDKTGLGGIYNYDLDVLRLEPPANNAGLSPQERLQAMRELDGQVVPNLLAAVERLGLKVVSAKGPVEVVVIDKVNQKPTEN